MFKGALRLFLGGEMILILEGNKVYSGLSRNGHLYKTDT